ncbi:MAG: hypothetical protein LAN84_03965 [Acidobacteriia bacterium]|nr:hypothetical protein [Terriglobia bacterium]
MTSRSPFAAVVFSWLALAGGAGAAQQAAPAARIAELQARFDRESNSGRKAKLLEKLGDAQFAESRRAGREGDYQAVGLLLEKYRDNVRTAFAAVRRRHPQAEKESGEYKRIEVHVRSGLRELDETLLVAPPQYRPPLQIVRDDLQQIEEELLRLLFPRRPGEQPAPQKPPAP